MNRTTAPRIMGAVVLAAAASRAGAQIRWQSVVLDPGAGGATESFAYCANGILQGGMRLNQPVLWDSSPDRFITLTPSGAAGGWVRGMTATQQAGAVSMPLQYPHAALWSGSPDSFVDLHPGSNYWRSEATAIFGGEQVGGTYRVGSSYGRAALWRGSAASFVDLHPTSATSSGCTATDGEYQGGAAYFRGSTDYHAVLWHGAPTSFVDLNPPGSFWSGIGDMVPGLQVGFAQPGIEPHAGLWRYTAESFQDLHPPGALYSYLFGTNGTMHVGSASFGGFARAGIWLNDSPSSYVNLHNYLPPGYGGSYATDISVVGNTIYVTGVGGQGINKAVLWIGTIPSPGTLAPMAGGIVAFSVRRR